MPGDSRSRNPLRWFRMSGASGLQSGVGIDGRIAISLWTPKDPIVSGIPAIRPTAHKLPSPGCGNSSTLRQYGGLSGFCKREESAYDTFNAGHAAPVSPPHLAWWKPASSGEKNIGRLRRRRRGDDGGYDAGRFASRGGTNRFYCRPSNDNRCRFPRNVGLFPPT